MIITLFYSLRSEPPTQPVAVRIGALCPNAGMHRAHLLLDVSLFRKEFAQIRAPSAEQTNTYQITKLSFSYLRDKK